MAADKTTSAGYWERRAWLRRLECSTAVKFVLLTLHEYAGHDEWAFPHQDTLAADVSLSERMVRRHLEWAISRGCWKSCRVGCAHHLDAASEDGGHSPPYKARRSGNGLLTRLLQ